MIYSLEKFLNSKTLYYDKIDYDVIKNSWNILKRYIKLPYVVHIIGTNGKGSTGRFLSSFLYQNNKNVIHYSSPHIIKFNERIWINGKDSSNKKLNDAHAKIQKILPSDLIEQLTYFEYTTLIAIYLSNNFDYLVLEAGLGGEFDATNVVENDLSIITAIGLDHQAFLGDTIEDIASTKLRSCDNTFIVSKQINSEVLSVKEKMLCNKNEILLEQFTLNKETKNLPFYLQNNLQVALSVLKYLDLNFDINRYFLPKLFGRYQKLTDNITIDVGHNPLAAKVIFEQLLKEKKKIILVYNSYKDKDYKEVLTILKPIIKEIQIIQCNDDRMVLEEVLIDVISDLCLNQNNYDIMKINSKNNYLVFGSFVVVENFLKDYKVYEKK